MSAVVELVENGRRERLEESAFPIALGGPEGIALPGAPTAMPLAYLGLADGELFVQPAAGGVTVNGAPIAASHWLRDGDVVRLGSATLALARRNGSLALELRGGGEGPPLDSGRARVASPTSFRPAGTAIAPVPFEPVPLDNLRKRRSPVSARTLVFFSVMTLLGLAAGFVLTARSVTLRIDPAPDRVRVEGGFPRIPFGERYLLRPGTYRVVAEKEGYRRLEESIEVGEAGSQRFDFALEKLPGYLALEVSPPEGATVLVDGEEKGTTPLAPLELPPGEHEIRVRRERYREITESVSVAGGGATESLTVELEPLWAPITFVSEPAGASVVVDGRALGKTPLTTELLEGSHAYEIALPRRKPSRGRVRVAAGEAKTVSPGSELELADGTLRVESVPGEASVSLDGVYQGVTPIEVLVAPSEPHRVEVVRAGYEAKTVEVSVSAGGSESLDVELVAKLGEVQIAATPADARLFVDGAARGGAQQVLQLPAVPHKIEIKKEGYKDFSTDLTPRPGFPQSVEVVLDPLVAPKKPLGEVIEAFDGQKLRLVEPRRFTMGAPRREPGRRANEVLHDVEITRPFYLATQEVTNGRFREFQASHRSGAIQGHSLEIDHHPVVNVSWEEAVQYCNWLSAKDSLEPAYVQASGKWALASPTTTGYRLPTEAEWELAARYAGGEAIKYPWGDALPVTPGSGNFADVTASALVTTTVPDYDDGYPATAPSDSFPPNALGIENLGGNVAEWVHDTYAANPTEPGESVSRDPLGAETGEFHVIRGSSYLSGSVSQLRLTYRDYDNKPRADVGFRIARWAE